MYQTKIACTVPLSAALAQRTGRHGDVDITLSDATLAVLSPEAVALIAEAATDTRQPGVLSVRLRAGEHPCLLVVKDDSEAAVAEALEGLVRRRAAEAEQARVNFEEHVARVLAMPLTEWIDTSRDGDAWFEKLDGGFYATDRTGRAHYRPSVVARPPCSSTRETVFRDPRVVARREQAIAEALPGAQAEWEYHYTGWKTAVAEREAKAVAAVEAEHRLVEEYGTRNQLERYEAGVLPSEELKALKARHENAKRDRLLPASPNLDPYEKLNADDCVDAHDDRDTGEEHVDSYGVRFRADPAPANTELTAEQWSTVKLVKAAHPEAEVTIMLHEAECKRQDCDACAVRYGIRAKLEDVCREYAMPEDEDNEGDEDDEA